MSGQHKTPLLGWHPRSAELDAWVRAEATTRGVPLSDLLDEALRLLHHKLTGTRPAGLSAWVRAEAERRRVPLSVILNEAVQAYREQEPLDAP